MQAYLRDTLSELASVRRLYCIRPERYFRAGCRRMGFFNGLLRSKALIV